MATVTQPKNAADLAAVCKTIRRHIIAMVGAAKSGRPGGSLSAVEALTSLFFGGHPRDGRIMDLAKAAESKSYCDDLKAKTNGLIVTQLASHLQGQLVASHPTFDTMFDVFAPASPHGGPISRVVLELLLPTGVLQWWGQPAFAGAGIGPSKFDGLDGTEYIDGAKDRRTPGSTANREESQAAAHHDSSAPGAVASASVRLMEHAASMVERLGLGRAALCAAFGVGVSLAVFWASKEFLRDILTFGMSTILRLAEIFAGNGGCGLIFLLAIISLILGAPPGHFRKRALFRGCAT